MARNLPCWHVPVAVEPGENVARFATEGFATVVRLPLKSAMPLTPSVRKSIGPLGLKTPLQLFLEQDSSASPSIRDGQPSLMDRAVLDCQVRAERI